MAAILRVMRPLNSQLPDPVVGNRRLLADLCRFIGVKVGTLPPESIGFPPEKPVNTAASQPGKPSAKSSTLAQHSALSPRQQQTLEHLLAGASEKQVARKMGLSQNTVHGYVKALYRRFSVSSRSELLVKHMNRP